MHLACCFRVSIRRLDCLFSYIRFHIRWFVHCRHTLGSDKIGELRCFPLQPGRTDVGEDSNSAGNDCGGLVC